MVYLDNAATTFPKPSCVIKNVVTAMEDYGANPGRSGHKLSVKAAEKIYSVREQCSELFGGSPENFCFTANATMALNMAIKGILKDGGIGICTCFDHNSVLRPLFAANKESNDKRNFIIDFNPETEDICQKIEEFLCQNSVKVLAFTHCSNVFGFTLPAKKLCEIAKKHGVLTVLDASQSSGHFNLNVKDIGADIVCTAGHKGLFGPMGTGIMYLSDGIKLSTVIEGGTGTNSMDLNMPFDLPERFEAGTVNMPGIVGLGSGIEFIKKLGVDYISEYEKFLRKNFIHGVRNISNVKLYYPDIISSGVISFNVKGYDSATVGAMLSDMGICVRSGFHCSYPSHLSVGTDSIGTVRVSFSVFNNQRQIDRALYAINKVACKR